VEAYKIIFQMIFRWTLTDE